MTKILGGVAICLTASLAVGEALSVQVGEIEAQRQRFNQAIAERDLAEIEAVLLPDYHIVTSRNGQWTGREASVENWGSVFAGDPNEAYVRTPRDIQVFERWGTAEELGDWEGTRIVRGESVIVSGRYAARWVRREGRWLLLAEVFTALDCRGPESACAAP